MSTGTDTNTNTGGDGDAVSRRIPVGSPFRRMPVRSLGFDRFSGLYLWAVFIIVFGIWSPGLFLTSSTLHAVASQQAVAAIVALGVLIPMAAGAYDLSVGANANLAAIVVTVLQSNRHWGMWPSILATVAISGLVGVVNGFIVVRLRVNSFIATLGTTSVISAVQSIVAGQAQPLPPVSNQWTELSQRTVGGFQIVFLYLVVIALIVWWVLVFTPAGRYIMAVGGNADAARLSGVRTGRWTWLSLVGSALICGIAGVLFASQTGPSLTFGSALLLPAFAAVFLGSTQLTPGRVNVWGTLIALYALATGIKGLQFVTDVQWLSDMFNGVAVVVAVSFAVWRQSKTSAIPAASKHADPDGPPPRQDAGAQSADVSAAPGGPGRAGIDAPASGATK